MKRMAHVGQTIGFGIKINARLRGIIEFREQTRRRTAGNTRIVELRA
jgi:hypothetical protein